MQLTIGDEEFGPSPQALGANCGVGGYGAGSTGGVHEAESFEVDGFEARALGEDVV